MSDCVRDYTVINSQPSIEAFENLMEEFFNTFGLTETIGDLFYYGVFFKPQNYANFDFNNGDTYDFEIPGILTNVCENENDKIDYVIETMGKVMRKEINKPEWMKYVEMNQCCNDLCMPPSSFLLIDAKEAKYEKLAQRLIEFLYSPNLTITMFNT